MMSIFIKSVFVISAFGIGTANQLKKLQHNHTPQRLPNGDIRQLVTQSNIKYFNEIIDNILIPRVVGTKNHEKVFDYITSELDKLGWNVEVDEFEEDTPKLGRLTFKNIVGVLNSNADRYLVLACHYDSKYFEREVFVATYATVASMPTNSLKQKNLQTKNIPNILIKPKNTQEATTTKTELMDAIKPSQLNIAIKKIQSTKKGSIEIKCNSIQDVQKLKKAAVEKLGVSYQIEETKLKNPQIKITGFDKNMTNIEVEQAIKNQNNLIAENELFEVVHIKTNTKSAIDSAVPCAMMLNLAKVLKPQFDSIKSNSDLSLKLVFFDGEEAFDQWGPRDSIYGARHLAAKYNKNQNVLRSTGESVTDLQKIDLLILLDLIGHSNVNFYNYFPETSRWFKRMADAEDRLDNLGLLKPRSTKYFVRRDYFGGNIEDDHLPFLRKNVPVLHLIPLPFPKQWHTPKDNKDIIDVNAVENLNMILRIFVTEYLHMLVRN
ncbi:unnamed protein product [Ceutorhynchus assimilis]|uniref:glutaminyl-peptide cyclotransferase n=1 Tax=Ceutorhynchus assimilis TaxID=467358 RepID=A0A9N9N2N2_9CUCU|nr:unnamed protein product [Ceutorhynchus assimilis]